jgi:flavin reductase (DIM6/NTAB) family NADH-FMN oxidoreductase RutF
MRKQVDEFKYVAEANRLMKDNGLLLVTRGKNGKPNAMTIGWGFLGTMWRRPMFIAAVRLSRHTYSILEESDSFTVCLPGKGMEAWLDFCGTKSGRDVDKFKELGMTAAEGIKVDAPHIEECPVHFECQVLYRDELMPGGLPKAVEDEVYPSKDMHVIYYGELKGVFETEGAAGNLG